MTTEQEIQHLADQISPLSPALAVRLRAVAARVAHQERVLDEMAARGCMSRGWPGRSASGPPRRGVRLGDGQVTVREFVAMIALLALVWAAVIAAVVWTIRIVAG